MAESYNHDAEPVLCANNCGFFGSKTTMNLCSKCYRDTVLNATAVQVAFEKTQKLNIQVAPDDEKSDLLPLIEGSSSDSAVAPPPVSDAPVNKASNKCFMCNKRVGLTGFKCRCGDLFCSTHRYSDSHNCSFDYKAAGRDAIAKANPIVKASKIDKI